MYNFANPERPRALRLPSGRGRPLAGGFQHVLQVAQQQLPRLRERRVHRSAGRAAQRTARRARAPARATRRARSDAGSPAASDADGAAARSAPRRPADVG
ncbi:MAG: Lon-like protease helical domain-containing protein [Chloroflexota bacterium]